MNQILIYTILVLVALGVISALVLYVVAQKFKVFEDPRIDETESLLPGANCGGCGFPGCRGLATALVESDDISALYCPVGGSEVMKKTATYLGKAAPEKEPTVAVVKCGGGCSVRPRTNSYDGAASCAVETMLYGGDTGCTWGCLGKGDCEVACSFDAIKVNQESGLPEVDSDKCTACGACVKACPKFIIELRRRGVKERRIYVECSSKDKGAVVRKGCSVGCIGCGKCVKVCPFDAITLKDNLAYIDASKCKFCRKCAAECPTKAIIELNFPPKKIVEQKSENGVSDIKSTTPKVQQADVLAENSPSMTEAIAAQTSERTASEIEPKLMTKDDSETVIKCVTEYTPEITVNKIAKHISQDVDATDTAVSYADATDTAVSYATDTAAKNDKPGTSTQA